MQFLDKLLNYYNISNFDYKDLIKEVSLNDLPFYECFEGIEKVVARIKKAIANKETIIIYGDYDCDGVLATSILAYTLSKLKANYNYYIPSRYIDEYGISKEKIDISKEKNYKLIVTVDNGVSCFEAIKRAKELGIDIIITDHHEYYNELDCEYFLHPKKSSLSCTTSGAVVAFFLSYALLNEVDPYLLSLAGISIISDIMPMRNENRTIVRLALKMMNEKKYPQLTILGKISTFTESTISTCIVPKINAICRVCKDKRVNYLVKYFISTNYKTMYKLSKFFIELNEKKKEIVKNVIDTIKINPDDSYIFLNINTLLGLGSLLATRYLNLYNKPIALFIENKDNLLKGSLRSKEGCDLSIFLKNNEDLFITSGGHKFASGITISKDKIEEFKRRFSNYISVNKFQISESIDLNIEEVNFENYQIIEQFSPFGESFEEPIFKLHNIDISDAKFIGKNKEHLKITFPNCSIIWFNYDKNKVSNQKSLNLIGKIKLNTFSKGSELQFLVDNCID